ncbi:MAG: hypothetical protein HLUCCX14_17680, partial [Marinobacter excellens HL-55]
IHVALGLRHPWLRTFLESLATLPFLKSELSAVRVRKICRVVFVIGCSVKIPGIDR